jgi:hypothetical protein
MGKRKHYGSKGGDNGGGGYHKDLITSEGLTADIAKTLGGFICDTNCFKLGGAMRNKGYNCKIS